MELNAVDSGAPITSIRDHSKAHGREFLASHGQNAPIGCAAQPEEIAQVVAFLASEQASFIVGSIVMADGGISIQVPQ